MTNDMFVFDRNKVRQNRNRCASSLDQHGFLIDWSMNQITSRLQDIKRIFPMALQIGCRSNKIDTQEFGIETLYTLDIAEKLSPDIQADEEFLPFAENSFDIIFSPLNLHTTNDLPGALSQIKRALKPDGLFVAAMLGGETLYELRQIISDAEIKLTNGLTPRIAPFADMQQMGALMQRAGFSLPVIDSEKITVTYDSPFKLMKDLRLMGEGNALIERSKKMSTKEFFAQINSSYLQQHAEDDGRITATFEIIFLIGWSPHESQQKPLRPGSAKMRLSDALKTKEGALPC